MRIYLKSLTLLVILLGNKVYSQEKCYPKTDIIVYYVNGINTKSMGEDNGYDKNWAALSTHVIGEYFKRRDKVDSQFNFNFVEKKSKEYYFNQSEGFINDIYETAEQKIKEWNDEPGEGETYREMREKIALKYQALSGYEVDSSTTKAIYNSIPKDQAPQPDGSLEEFVDHLKKERLKYEIINSTADPRVQDVEKLYFKLVEHINNKDRVILFSHSQGNLFIDEVIKEMNDNGIDFSKYLINVRYGSPSGPGTSVGLNYKDVKYHTDFVTGYIGIPQTHHAKGSGTPTFVYKMNHVLVRSKSLSIVSGVISTLVSSAITGDATGHGMKEWYVEPNIMTSEDDLSFSNPVRANDLSMNYLDELFETFGDTCSRQLEFDTSSVSLSASCPADSNECTFDIENLKVRADFTDNNYQSIDSDQFKNSLYTSQYSEEIELSNLQINRSQYDYGSFHFPIPKSEYAVKYKYLNNEDFEYTGSFELDLSGLELVVLAKTTHSLYLVSSGDYRTISSSMYLNESGVFTTGFQVHELSYQCRNGLDNITTTFLVANTANKSSSEIENAIRSFNIVYPVSLEGYECWWSDGLD